ncbi:MAG: gephyrin-like molybdotransferase Glp [Pseudomonadota bacterium]
MSSNVSNTNAFFDLETALTAIENKISQLAPRSSIALPITEADNHILAEDIKATMPVPPFNNSAMDGFALSLSTNPDSQTFTLVGEALAGKPFTKTIAPKQCIRITTGGVLPTWADTVVMKEDTTFSKNTMTLISTPEIGANIRKKGCDIAEGEVILHQGTRLTPAMLGLLASLGIASAPIVSPLKVAVLSTGDELQPSSNPLQPGQIYESNRITLITTLQRAGFSVIDHGIIPDDPEALQTAFTQASQSADVVISSGGVSVGEADHVKTIISTIGEINFWKIAIKPGKPLAFGTIKNKLFFGLPGNPVSALVTLLQVVLPSLRYWQGEKAKKPTLMAIINHPIRKRAGRLDFQRGIYRRNDKGILEVGTTGSQSSGILSSVARANCFIPIPRESTGFAQGETVEIIPFDKYLI